ncbi:hypothetical protein J7E78_22495 [Paenibacillus polymyxa]|uniref:hypothetical protein n=1 Tax=Paenibacillus polymyxa TaxID=1406 RepID=UPI001BE92214|nr:hypothetical protein [Paenibacillus polymyxa]MBT2286303.1 hypothetical protein [Paenibacillus polymyxa]
MFEEEDEVKFCPVCEDEQELDEIEEDVFACPVCGYISDTNYDPTNDYDPNIDDPEELAEKIAKDAEKAADRW